MDAHKLADMLNQLPEGSDINYEFDEIELLIHLNGKKLGVINLDSEFCTYPNDPSENDV